MENKNTGLQRCYGSEASPRRCFTNRTFIFLSLFSPIPGVKVSEHYIELCMSDSLKNNDIILRLCLGMRAWHGSSDSRFFYVPDSKWKINLRQRKSHRKFPNGSQASDPLRVIAINKSPELQKLICHKCLRNCENFQRKLLGAGLRNKKHSMGPFAGENYDFRR